jgi:hypothetical protein
MEVLFTIPSSQFKQYVKGDVDLGKIDPGQVKTREGGSQDREAFAYRMVRLCDDMGI